MPLTKLVYLTLNLRNLAEENSRASELELLRRDYRGSPNNTKPTLLVTKQEGLKEIIHCSLRTHYNEESILPISLKSSLFTPDKQERLQNVLGVNMPENSELYQFISNTLEIANELPIFSTFTEYRTEKRQEVNLHLADEFGHDLRAVVFDRNSCNQKMRLYHQRYQVRERESSELHQQWHLNGAQRCRKRSPRLRYILCSDVTTHGGTGYRQARAGRCGSCIIGQF
uniref:Uncharacterized protein n=1 Tax=Glossina palpalis gambiensis TaxID=67801 RepID=A0A1B0B9U8_9MUSC